MHDQGAELVLEGLATPAVATYLTQRFGTGALAYHRRANWQQSRRTLMLS